MSAVDITWLDGSDVFFLSALPFSLTSSVKREWKEDPKGSLGCLPLMNAKVTGGRKYSVHKHHLWRLWEKTYRVAHVK